MKISELFLRGFTHDSDLKGSTTVTIKDITLEELHPVGQPVNKFVLGFDETPHSVLLTHPLAFQIAEILGDDT